MLEPATWGFKAMIGMEAELNKHCDPEKVKLLSRSLGGFHGCFVSFQDNLCSLTSLFTVSQLLRMLVDSSNMHLRLMRLRVAEAHKSYTWCGIADLFAGQCIVPFSGLQMVIAMPIDAASVTFHDEFGENPGSIGQLCTWLLHIPLEKLLENRVFFVALTKGKALIIPPGHIIAEACLGEHGFGFMSFPVITKEYLDSIENSNSLLGPICDIGDLTAQIEAGKIFIAGARTNLDDIGALTSEVKEEISNDNEPSLAEECIASMLRGNGKICIDYTQLEDIAPAAIDFGVLDLNAELEIAKAHPKYDDFLMDVGFGLEDEINDGEFLRHFLYYIKDGNYKPAARHVPTPEASDTEVKSPSIESVHSAGGAVTEPHGPGITDKFAEGDATLPQ
jgi:hypothetical protein